MQRPFRPRPSELQPIAIEPTAADREEAGDIARLVGYLNIFLPFNFTRTYLDWSGEIIVWQIAGWEESKYLAVAQQAVQEARAMSDQRLKAVCSQGLPTLLKYNYFLSDDGRKTLEDIARRLAEADAC
jgi:hypothetical protein